MNKLDINRVADRLAERVRTVTASLADFRQVSPTLAQVILAFNTLEAKRPELFSAVAAAMSNNARPVEGSFREVSSYGNPSLVGYVALNREVRPYEEASAKKMVALASNMLMDTADDSLWDVRTDGAGNKLLCRQSQADLSELLVTARVRQKAPKLDSIQSGVYPGAFVSFVDPKTEQIRAGYVLATEVEIEGAPVSGIDVDPNSGVEIYALPDNDNMDSDELRGDGESPIAERLDDGVDSFIVPASLIVEVAHLGKTDVEYASKKAKKELAAPANSQSKEAMKEYYKQMFSYAPDYYADLVKMIDQHANI